MESRVEHSPHCHTVLSKSLCNVTSPVQGVPALLITEKERFFSYHHALPLCPSSNAPLFPTELLLLITALALSLNHHSASDWVISTTVWQCVLSCYWEQRPAGLHEVLITLCYCNTPRAVLRAPPGCWAFKGPNLTQPNSSLVLTGCIMHYIYPREWTASTAHGFTSGVCQRKLYMDTFALWEFWTQPACVSVCVMLTHTHTHTSQTPN